MARRRPGKIRASRANTRASTVMPVTVMPQPMSALNPYGASDAGSRKIPMPIVLPITSAVHIQKPSSFPDFATGTATCSLTAPAPAPPVARVGFAQPLVEMPHALFALRAQAAGLVEPGGETLLHGFADHDVLVLDRVAERAVLVDPGHGAGVLLIVVVELDPAAIGPEGQDAVGLHAPGHHVQHDVGIHEEIQRLAVAVDRVGVPQRRMLHRIPGKRSTS